jgi:uncharacterized membrane protein YeaQ/YmgE (transglycosylase-associated protein family)
MLTIILITAISGILIGFATSARTPTDGLEDLTRNILVGMAGAFVGLKVAEGIYSSAETGAFALVVAALTGATLLLFIVNRVRRT